MAVSELLLDDPEPTSLLRHTEGNGDIGSYLLDAAPDVRAHYERPPILRGWFHLVAFVASLPAGVLVVTSAPSGRARVAALVYAVALSALFAVSSVYHLRVWTPEGRRRMRRVDHATIYLMIAGCYTPICLLVLPGATGGGVLVAAWAGAAIGLGFAITGLAEKPVFGLACYISLGWGLIVALPELTRQLSPAHVLLLIAGGLAYTVGAVVLGTNRPNPYPRVFGYHEVWHVLVTVACACHYVTIRSVVQAGA
jgi:hemolysin III